MRIRTIKPEFFLHEGLVELEQSSGLPVRLAFIGLWCIADREGRFKWEPRKLGVQVFPYEAVNFAAILIVLEKHGIIQQYGESGQYGCIPSFLDHQCINSRESKSSLPPVTETHVHARACTVITNEPETLDIPAHGEGKGNGREGEGKGNGKEQGKEGNDAPAGEEVDEVCLSGIYPPEVIEIWIEWDAYRTDRAKAKGRDSLPWTQRAKRMSAKEIETGLQDHPSDVIIAQIRAAIAGNWKGTNINTIRPPSAAYYPAQKQSSLFS